jgi:tetratricopeptide (TPR) repeat protein
LGANSCKVYALLYAKKENEADALIKKAVADNPANYPLYGVRAQTYRELGQINATPLFKNVTKKELREAGQKLIDKAIEDYSTMVALDPSGIAGRYERADLYQKYKEDYPKAISDLTKLIELDPSKAWKYLFQRGYCYKLLGQKDDAVKDWEQSLEKKPGYTMPLDELAAYSIDTKNVANAVKYLDQYIAVTESKPTPDYHWLAEKLLYYVNFLADNGQCRQANEYLNKASQHINKHYAEFKRLNLALYSTWEISATESAGKLAACAYNTGDSDIAIEPLINILSIMKERVDADYITLNASNKLDDDGILRSDYLDIGKVNLELGHLYIAKKQYVDAINSFTEGIEACKKCVSHTSLSPKLKKSNYEYMLQSVNNIVQTAYFGRATSYRGLGQYEMTNSDMKKGCSLGDQAACDYLKPQ